MSTKNIVHIYFLWPGKKGFFSVCFHGWMCCLLCHAEGQSCTELHWASDLLFQHFMLPWLVLIWFQHAVKKIAYWCTVKDCCVSKVFVIHWWSVQEDSSVKFVPKWLYLCFELLSSVRFHDAVLLLYCLCLISSNIKNDLPVSTANEEMCRTKYCICHAVQFFFISKLTAPLEKSHELFFCDLFNQRLISVRVQHQVMHPEKSLQKPLKSFLSSSSLDFVVISSQCTLEFLFFAYNVLKVHSKN